MSNVVTYQPSAPVQSPQVLRTVLEEFRERLQSVMASHMSTDRFMVTAGKAIAENPDLLKCTQESVIMAVMNAAELGLDVSKSRGEAYLLPFGRNCQLVIGYRGKVKLARQTGEVRRIEAEVVHEHDHFAYTKGTQFRLDFTPNLAGDRGDPVGAYSLVEFIDGGIQAEYMSKDEIHQVQKSSRSGKSGPWQQWPGEMWRKTVFNRLWKWLPISSDVLVRAQELEHQEYVSAQQEAPRLPVASSLAAKLKARVVDDPAPEVEPEAVEEPEPMVLLDEAAVTDLNIKIAAAGISVRDVKLQFLSSVTGRAIYSSKQLTEAEADGVVRPMLAAGYRMVDKVGKRQAAKVWKRWASTGEEYSDMALGVAFKLEESDQDESKGAVSEALYAPAE